MFFSVFFDVIFLLKIISQRDFFHDHYSNQDSIFKKMCSMFSFPHIFFTLFSTVVRLFEAAGTVIFTAEVSRSDLGYPKQDRSRRGKSPIGGAIGVLS